MEDLDGSYFPGRMVLVLVLMLFQVGTFIRWALPLADGRGNPGVKVCPGPNLR